MPKHLGYDLLVLFHHGEQDGSMAPRAQQTADRSSIPRLLTEIVLLEDGLALAIPQPHKLCLSKLKDGDSDDLDNLGDS